MKEIIAAFPAKLWAASPSKAQWQAAADSWRLPYWDYATKPAIPQIAATPDIDVLGFDGKRVQYGEGVKFAGLNPMYTFQPKVIGYQTFGDLPEKLSLPTGWNTPIGTSRHPETPANFNAGISNIQNVGAALNKPDWTTVDGPKSAGTIKEVVSRLINDKYFNNYSKFASTRYVHSGKPSDPQPRDWLSLENLHNAIHGFVGGFGAQSGQMSDPSVAAFDPIFWVHHCFIDMIFHSWQVNTNYAYFFNDPIDGLPSEKASTWLKPFHGSSNSEISSSTVKETKALNYTYDRIIEKKSPDGAIDRSVRLGVRKMVNEHFNMTGTEATNILPDRKTDNDLIVNVAYSRFDLNNGEPYWIHFFVGDVGEPEHYLNNPNLVGGVYNFSAPIDHSGCQNCQEQLDAGALATGQVPITGAVLKDWVNVAVPGLPTSGPFNEATVSAYLKDHFQWRVVRANGEPVPIESLPNLKVIVLLGDADHSQDLEVSSTFTNYEPLWDATNTKVGGGRVGDHYG